MFDKRKGHLKGRHFGGVCMPNMKSPNSDG